MALTDSSKSCRKSTRYNARLLKQWIFQIRSFPFLLHQKYVPRSYKSILNSYSVLSSLSAKCILHQLDPCPFNTDHIKSAWDITNMIFRQIIHCCLKYLSLLSCIYSFQRTPLPGPVLYFTSQNTRFSPSFCNNINLSYATAIIVL